LRIANRAEERFGTEPQILTAKDAKPTLSNVEGNTKSRTKISIQILRDLL